MYRRTRGGGVDRERSQKEILWEGKRNRAEVAFPLSFHFPVYFFCISVRLLILFPTLLDYNNNELPFPHIGSGPAVVITLPFLGRSS